MGIRTVLVKEREQKTETGKCVVFLEGRLILTFLFQKTERMTGRLPTMRKKKRRHLDQKELEMKGVVCGRLR